MTAAVPLATPRFSDSPNARSKSITTTTGPYSQGILNQHLDNNKAYQVGVHDDKGQRRTMEDAYSFIVDFAGVRGQGYFAVFDGHAGKYAAEWCGGHFHEHLLEVLRTNSTSPIPDVLNRTFHSVDSSLSAIAAKDDKMHSGCTAVMAFIRIEDAHGGQSFLEQSPVNSPRVSEPSINISDRPESPNASGTESPVDKKYKKSRASRVVSAIKSLSTPSRSSSDLASTAESAETTNSSSTDNVVLEKPVTPPSGMMLRRVLYTANAGDARGVLCRGGKAIRLTYDHKGSDRQEAKRIMDAGGFVMGGRVNGVLAVTRSLGDSSMKEFVVGSPFTTETELGEEDEFLILACDGLWDIATDQQAVDLVRDIHDAQVASRTLVDFALKESTDNITVVVVRFPVAGKS
ncbi:protein serine/threonine phosphatase 2C [Rickenella mellea]|uniref:Protein serine/threonine phosphatase 2C n=1 Tax=Rickenella mellea TaxID=50990 RepID=A0A4Y7Q5B8_9AGAM|nr:protein serine/threonine phosphatase 2C [Rickenella mellea]